jgi:glutamine---fructose-6-phosphate transaminase (isomerizing)
MVLSQAERSLEGYIGEISGVPAALERLCEFVSTDARSLFVDVANRARDSSGIFILGMASSQWASWPISLALKHAGLTVHWMSAYDALIGLSVIPKDSLIILVSQSGETVELLNLLDRLDNAANRPTIVGFTNSSESTMASRCDLVIDVLAGQEIHAPSKTYVNTVAALLLFHAFVVGQESGLPDECISDLLEMKALALRNREAWATWGEEVAISFAQRPGPLQFLALGSQMASAWQSSMLCAETVRTFSAVLDWASFRHGFEPQVDDAFTAVGFKPAGPGPDVWTTALQSITARGGQAFLVPDSLVEIGAADFEVLSLRDLESTVLATVPIHWFCIGLARHKGLDPSRIERKVTRDL